MSEWSGFFDAHFVEEAWDRVYLAEHFARYFSKFIGNGVYAKSSDSLQVFQSSPASMSVILSPGAAYIDGYTYENDSDKSLTLTVADGVLDRIDLVVSRWSAQDREIKTTIKTGVASVNAVPPTLQWDSDCKELQLAEILVPAGAASITQSNIKDTRPNNSVCGWVTAVVSQVDTKTLFLQWQAAYEEEYARTQDYLEAQKAAWETFFESVQEDMGLPVPTVDTVGFAPVVNPHGNGYSLLEVFTLLNGRASKTLDMGSNSLTGIPTPTADGDAVPKSYSDNASHLSDGTVNANRLPTVPISKGGTGATTVEGARNALGLGNTGGAVPIANGGTGGTSAPTAVKNLGLTGLMKRKLVWENASPGSDFGANTVTLSAANGLNVVSWDIVYIIARGNNAAVVTASTEYGASGHRANYTIYGTSVNVFIRQCAQSGLNFSFENAKSNASAYPGALIPYQIYANYLNQGE